MTIYRDTLLQVATGRLRGVPAGEVESHHIDWAVSEAAALIEEVDKRCGKTHPDVAQVKADHIQALESLGRAVKDPNDIIRSSDLYRAAKKLSMALDHNQSIPVARMNLHDALAALEVDYARLNFKEAQDERS